MPNTLESQVEAEPRHEHRPKPRRRLRRGHFLVGGGLLVAVTIATGYAFFHRDSAAPTKQSDPAESTSSSEAEAVTVSIVKPQEGGLARYSKMIGSLQAYESAELFAKVSGFLKTQEIERDGKVIPVDIGLHVNKGDVLAEIDDPEVHAEADKAAADLEEAHSQAAQAKAAIETAKMDLEAARAAVKQAEADVGRWTAHREEKRKAFDRYKGLGHLSAVEQEVVDQKEDEYESAVAAEESSKAEVVTTKAKVAAATAKVTQSEADYQAALANVKVVEAILKKAKVLVDYTLIRSPYTGVITERNFHVGDFIRSAADGNTKPLLSVNRTDVLRLVTKIPDLDVPYVDVEDPATVTLQALPGLKLHGKVARFSEAEEPLERMMRTEVDLPNNENSPGHGRLREGMYGEAIITLEPPTKFLSLPSACVVDRDNKHGGKIFVSRDGRAQAVPVTTGEDDGLRIEIVSGLNAKDRVIVPSETVSDGAPILPTEETDSGASTGQAKANGDTSSQ